MSLPNHDPVLDIARAKVSHYLGQYPDMPANDRAIHELRVLTKYLRGCLRLYPRDCEPACRAADHKLKVLARAYAGLREARVQRNAIRKLCNKASARQRRQLRSLESLLATPNPDQDDHPNLPPPGPALAGALELWPRTPMPPAAIKSGLDHIYRKVRKRGKKATSRGNVEQLHQWRKWIKYWLYCLEGLPPGCSEKQRRHLKKLASSLGQYHDWQMLEAALQASPEAQNYREALAVLEKLLAKRRKRRLRRFTQDHKKLTRSQGAAC